MIITLMLEIRDLHHYRHHPKWYCSWNHAVQVPRLWGCKTDPCHPVRSDYRQGPSIRTNNADRGLIG